MNLDQQIQENQKKIADLASSMSLWLGTPSAKKPAIRARITELQDRTLHRLKELEIAGQQEKITSMTEVGALLKGEASV